MKVALQPPKRDREFIARDPEPGGDWASIPAPGAAGSRRGRVKQRVKRTVAMAAGGPVRVVAEKKD